ncbi:MAG: hypothetical protein WDM90_06520 [Ferruginibacter sp.]
MEEWEKTQSRIKTLLLNALELSKLPASPNTKPIITPKENMMATP